MTLNEVYSNLCSYDESNPLYADIYDEVDERPVPRVNCYCDNCFYGRDKLALEIILLRTAITNNQNHYR